jgi:WD40 repeat protein
LTTSEDGTARVWNARTGEPVSPYLRHGARIWRGAFSPDGRTVATGSDDRTVRLWDPETGLPMSGSLEHSDSVGRLAFSPDGHRLLTFGGQVRLWDSIEAQTPVPMWFCDLVEALAGVRRREDGQLLPVGPEAISKARELARGGVNADFYSRWAKWFLIERMQESPPMFRSE